MRKGLIIALGLAAFVAVQSASADCRSEFKDCSIRNRQIHAAETSAPKPIFNASRSARQAAHQTAKIQHDIAAAPKAAVTNAAKTKTIGSGVKQSTK